MGKIFSDFAVLPPSVTGAGKGSPFPGSPSFKPNPPTSLDSPFHLRPPLSEMAAAAAAAGLLPPLPPPPPRFPGAPGAGAAVDLDPFSLQRKLQEQQQQQRMGLQAAMAAAVAGGAAGLGQNIYEVAALTQEMDTMQLTLRVKEVLTANNICQKVRM